MRISTLCMTAIFCASVSTVSAQTEAAQDMTMKAKFTTAAPLAAPQNARFRAAKHPIDEQPDGELRLYELATYYYSQNMDEWVHRYGQKTLVVFDGNDVYIQNIINTHTYGTWIRGEITADRKHIVFDNFQPYVEQGDYTYYVSLAYADAEGVYWGDTESDEFQLSYDEATGVISNPDLELTLASDGLRAHPLHGRAGAAAGPHHRGRHPALLAALGQQRPLLLPPHGLCRAGRRRLLHQGLLDEEP